MVVGAGNFSLNSFRRVDRCDSRLDGPAVYLRSVLNEA